MKHIYDDHQTRKLIEEWAAASPFGFASFFVWNSGTCDQRSQVGLLLFQILRSHPDLLPIVLPTVWARCYSIAVKQDEITRNYEVDPWTLQSLKDALRTLVNQKMIPFKIVLFIDGIDEFHGDHEEMALLMLEITRSKDIKVCLSSRPWVVFEGLFSSSAMLRLQNLTHADIEKYVRDKLHLNRAYQRLIVSECPSKRDLVHDIVDKAEGVFLWVTLVVRSLLDGIRNRDEMFHLWKRFDLMPPELEFLYGHFLTLFEPIYLPWVSKAFQIVQTNQINEILQPLTISDLSLAINEKSGQQIFKVIQEPRHTQDMEGKLLNFRYSYRLIRINRPLKTLTNVLLQKKVRGHICVVNSMMLWISRSFECWKQGILLLFRSVLSQISERFPSDQRKLDETCSG